MSRNEVRRRCLTAQQRRYQHLDRLRRLVVAADPDRQAGAKRVAGGGGDLAAGTLEGACRQAVGLHLGSQHRARTEQGALLVIEIAR